MKKSFLRRLGLITIALALITCSLMGKTLTKYVTEISGNKVTATAATWEFNTSGQTAMTLALDGCKTGKICPGDSGSFDVIIKHKTDVSGKYVITFTSIPSGIGIYTDAACTEGNKIEANGSLTGTFAAQESETTITQKIYWKTIETTAATTLDASTMGDVVFNIVGEQVAANTTIS